MLRPLSLVWPRRVARPVNPVHIRRAAEADAAEIAAIHIEAWQWAYRGQIPDAYLDGLTQTIDQRVAWWKAKLGGPVPRSGPG